MEDKWMDVIASIVGGFLGAILGFWGFVAGLGIELYGAYKGEESKFSRWGISLASGGLAGWLHGNARAKAFTNVWSAFDYNLSLTDRFKALSNITNLVTPQQVNTNTAIGGSTGGLLTVS